MAVLEDEYASARIVGETHRSLVDLPLGSRSGRHACVNSRLVAASLA